MKAPVIFLALLCAAACGEARATVQYEGAAYRDPFRRNRGDDKADMDARREFDGLRSLTFGGVASGPGGAQAFVSGQLVEVGSVVGGAEVTAIGKNSVTLNYKGKEIVLKEKGN